MADEMDPCECIWSHEMAMRRLLSWIRQSQSYCTDTECIDELPGANGQLSVNNFLMMSLFVAFIIAMYIMRPSNVQNYVDPDIKPRGNGQGGNGAPPTPPPATS